MDAGITLTEEPTHAPPFQVFHLVLGVGAIALSEVITGRALRVQAVST